MDGEILAFTYLAIGRLLAYLAGFAFIGAASYRFVVLPRLRREGGDVADWTRTVERGLATLGLAAGVVLVVAVLWRLYAQTFSVFGLDEGVSLDAVRIVVLQTQWGSGWIVQLGTAALAVGAGMVAMVRPRPGWVVVGVAALGIGVSLPLTGHALSHAGPAWVGVVLQAGHLLGGGIWLGTLLAVFVFGLSSRRSPPRAGATVSTMIDAFSPIALLGGGVLMATGVITAVLYLSSLRDLWQTAYGLTLLLKLLLVGGVAVLGARNWRVVRPTLGTDEASKHLRRSTGLELLLAAWVLAVTAALAALALE